MTKRGEEEIYTENDSENKRDEKSINVSRSQFPPASFVFMLQLIYK
jgi:hypothetical protein